MSPTLIIANGLYCDGKGTRKVVAIADGIVAYVRLSGARKREAGAISVKAFAKWAAYRCLYVEKEG